MGRQHELLEMMKATGKSLVVVLIKGRPLAVKDCDELADALVDAWYPGIEGGNAVADVLFGDYNPAGRLAVSVPESVGQVPVFYNHNRSNNRSNYVEGTGKPLYPFGYGLSYTTSNSGAKAGDEVIQVYVRDKVCSHAKPVMELKAFQRVHFDAGETQEVELRIPRAELEVYQGGGEWKFEPGEFVIMAGGSSDKLPLQETIRLE